jgi:hypothetical protein
MHEHVDAEGAVERMQPLADTPARGHAAARATWTGLVDDTARHGAKSGAANALRSTAEAAEPESGQAYENEDEGKKLEREGRSRRVGGSVRQETAAYPWHERGFVLVFRTFLVT